MTAVYTQGIPVGIRLNNPLNIKRTSINWQGKAAVQSHPVFETFESPHWGIRAAARNLLTYYRRDKLDTIAEIVNRWAPPEDDNNTAAYIDFVADKMGVAPDVELNLEDPEVLGGLVLAMMAMEVGSVPYSLATVKAAVAAASVGGSPGPVVSVVTDPVHPPGAQPSPTPAKSSTPPLVDQPSAAPTNKVTAGSIGAMGGLPVAFVAKVFWDRYIPEQPMPVEIAIAIAAAASSLFSFIAGYYTRNRATSIPPGAPTAQG